MKITYEFTDDDMDRLTIMQRAPDLFLGLANVHQEVYAFKKWGSDVENDDEFRKKTFELIQSILEDIDESGYHAIS